MSSLNQIANISNAVPILQQERSQITTNPFIPNEQKTLELETLDKQANAIIEEQYNKNKTASIFNLTIKQINKNVSSSFIGFFNDLFAKPKDMPWRIYVPMILQKDQRYTYIGVLLIVIAIYMLAVRA
jgi:hypothetical protein